MTSSDTTFRVDMTNLHRTANGCDCAGSWALAPIGPDCFGRWGVGSVTPEGCCCCSLFEGEFDSAEDAAAQARASAGHWGRVAGESAAWHFATRARNAAR